MKKAYFTLLLFFLFFNTTAQEVGLKKKWSLGFSFTPNISYLYNPTNYFEDVVPTRYNTTVKDKPILEHINFGIRISNVLNKKAEIETGIILSNKDYNSPRGWIHDIMLWGYSKPKIFFIEVPLIYKHNISKIGNYNLNLTGGIIASIPIYEYIDYPVILYHYATDGQDYVITQNLDFYPLCGLTPY